MLPNNPFDPRIIGDNLLERIFRTTAGPVPAHPTLIAWYWLFVLVAGFGATAWWYRRRATRLGVETDTRAFLIAPTALFLLVGWTPDWSNTHAWALGQLFLPAAVLLAGGAIAAVRYRR